MEFKLKSVDGSLRDYKNSLNERGHKVYKKERERSYDVNGLSETIYYDMMVSVNTLDELMNLIHTLDYDVIIHCNNNEIWIYDGNIE